MLAQVKHEKGWYLVQVYRTDSITGHQTWQTVAKAENQSDAIRLREFCRYEGNEDEIDVMRAFYLDTHNK